MMQDMAVPAATAYMPHPTDSSPVDWPAPLRHLAVILDGNRRWADRLGLQSIDGYRAGGRNVHALLSWCSEVGIQTVTLWPLSAENLTRDPDELRGLLTVIADVFDELSQCGRWHLHIIGDLGRLPPATAHRIRAAEQRTAGVAGLNVNIAVAYSGRLELLHAVRALIADHLAAGTLDTLLAQLDPELLASRLYTAGQPDPDLVIRTSGEQRLSNFMLWQSAFSEFHFTPVCWPDFSRADFDEALRTYQSRHRRFGQ
ncbi:polyprenyl diphosphate synthase [Burkholderia multivorans]|uniref:polyprenyl diphosphate synthase n=1 Tax=Burkholderia multivorans TaxID=87883 RepID=UPI0018C8817F|nr:polyprenyl diphosphate synthase [Burkholderia multivorans]MBU9340929.1 di-trans,poly-cis-decaprenylcistransferase [Burkholderia multivorans]